MQSLGGVVWIFSTFLQRGNGIFNENYEVRWIGRIGMVAWSAELPDLSPLDFFLWGCMKRVYRVSKAEGRHQLVEAINEATTAGRKHTL
jgi:hypothetical protein